MKVSSFFGVVQAKKECRWVNRKKEKKSMSEIVSSSSPRSPSPTHSSVIHHNHGTAEEEEAEGFERSPTPTVTNSWSNSTTSSPQREPPSQHVQNFQPTAKVTRTAGTAQPTICTTPSSSPSSASVPLLDPALQLLKRLSPNVQILRRRESAAASSSAATAAAANPEIFVRYTITKDQRWKATRIVHMVQLASRHPNFIMPFCAVKHRDGSCDIDSEYADAGSLLAGGAIVPLVVSPSSAGAVVPSLSSSTSTCIITQAERIGLAKSVARQLLEGLFYFAHVHDKQHRNISPSTVFFRRDGCVKLGFFDLIDEQLVREDPELFLASPYCAPECRKSVAARVASEAKADVWAVGVLILAIVTGKTFLPRHQTTTTRAQQCSNNDCNNNNGENDANNTKQQTTQEADVFPSSSASYPEEKRFFEDLLLFPPPPSAKKSAAGDGDNDNDEKKKNNNSDPSWERAIPDPALRYLAQRCLALRVESRASLVEAHALTMLLGGLLGSNSQNHQRQTAEDDEKSGSSNDLVQDPFSTSVEAFATGGGSSTSKKSSSSSSASSLIGAKSDDILKILSNCCATAAEEEKSSGDGGGGGGDGHGHHHHHRYYNVNFVVKCLQEQLDANQSQNVGGGGGEDDDEQQQQQQKQRQHICDSLQKLTALLFEEITALSRARADPSTSRPLAEKAMKDLVRKRGRIAWSVLKRVGATIRTNIKSSKG